MSGDVKVLGYKFGALPSTDIDLLYTTVYSPKYRYTLPETLDLRPYLRPIRDQGLQGSCVAFAASCIVEYFAKNSRASSVMFSPQFIYNCRPRAFVEGMTIVDCAQILHELGAPYERDYPYGLEELKSDIPEEVFTLASQWKIRVSSKVLTTEYLKYALKMNGPCIATFPAYNYSEKFWHRQPDDEGMGGHAVAVVGYTETGFILRNSWGEEWGKNGYVEYPYSDWGMHTEIWTFVDDPKRHPKKIIDDIDYDYDEEFDHMVIELNQALYEPAKLQKPRKNQLSKNIKRACSYIAQLVS
jgi:C1A family cysteine protease